jgi:hypothetical protein
MSDAVRAARPPHKRTFVRAPLPHSFDDHELLPDPIVARERYHVTTRTLRRWDEANVGFPPPIRIRNRNYRNRAALDAWDRANSLRLAAEGQRS